MHESRKVVTVFFADVVGSTAIGERLDAEAVRRLQARWFAEAEAALGGHGGTVEKFIGDAVMAVFGIPDAHEDDALRAVRAGLELRQRIAQLNDELETFMGARLVLRTGITTGEAVVGDASARQALVTGDVVNTAKRLEEAAPHGEILVGETTRALVRGAVELEAVGPVAAKGKSEPVAAWRVVALGRAGSEAARSDPPLVDRRDELAFLLEAVDRAAGERRCIVATVLGPPGIGKSRLGRELTARLGGDVTVLTGRCVSYGYGATWWPLAEMIRDSRLDVRAALAGASDGGDVACRVESAIGASTDTYQTDEIFWAVRRLAEHLAGARPLVLCVDDAHWAEPVLHDLVDYLEGFLRDAPVVVLRLARPELAQVRPIRPSWPTLELDALAAPDADDLLEALGAPDAVRTGIVATAEGNPLFLEQLAFAARDDPGDSHGIPPSIEAVLSARLDQLMPHERDLLGAAAVVGRRFGRRILAAAADDTERADLAGNLLSLARRGFIRPDTSEREDAYRFAHGLIRDAAYRRVPKRTRAHLHRRVAELVAADSETASDELTGYHLEQAHRLMRELGGPTDEMLAVGEAAASALLTAAGRAFARDDMSAAAALFERGASLLPAGDPSRLDALRDHAQALWELGRHPDAVAAVEQLHAEATEAGNERLAALAELERIAYDQLAGSSTQLVRRAAERAIELCTAAGDELGVARAWRRLASAHRRVGEYAAGASAARAAVDHARAAGSRAEEARAVDGLCNCLLYGPTPVEEALATCATLLESSEGTRALEANVLGVVAGLKAMSGDLAAARIAYNRAASTLEELGLELPRAALTQIGAPLELAAGDAVAAEREARRGARIFAEAGSAALQVPLIAEALEAQGRFAAAEAELARVPVTNGPPIVPWQVRWRIVQARLHAAAGRFGDGVEAVREGAEIADRTDDLSLRGDAWAAIADALTRAGLAEDAAGATDVARALYRRKGNALALARLEALPAAN